MILKGEKKRKMKSWKKWINRKTMTLSRGTLRRLQNHETEKQCFICEDIVANTKRSRGSYVIPIEFIVHNNYSDHYFRLSTTSRERKIMRIRGNL